MQKAKHVALVAALSVVCVAPVWAAVSGAQVAPVDVTADLLELKQSEGYAVFSGHVKAEHGKLKLGAEFLEVYYNEDDASENEEGAIEKIVAREDVTVVYDTDTATGDEAVYTPKKNEVALKGNVVLVRGGSVLKGTKLVYNTATGDMKLHAGRQSDGRIKATFAPAALKK